MVITNAVASSRTHQTNHPGSASYSAPVRSGYTEVTRQNLSDNILSGSLTIVTLFKDVANLIPHAGPLVQILTLTKELILVVNEMKDNREGCEGLVERILMFVMNLAEEMKRLNVPLYDGTPTAARLYALLLNIKAIRDDARKWRDWNTFKRFARRNVIKANVAKHGQHLSDCFHTFSVLSLLQMGAISDLRTPAARSPASTTNAPISSILSNCGPEDSLASSEPPAQLTLSLGNSSTDSISLQQLLQQSGGRTMLEQIGLSVQSRGEELGIPYIPASLDARTPPKENLNAYRPKKDEHTEYLARRLGELTSEVDHRLPDVNFKLEHKDESITFGGYHIPQAGEPTRQLRQTIKDAFGLLDRLQDTNADIQAEFLADEMQTLSVNLCDLGMWSEALGVQTFCVVFRRGLVAQDPSSHLFQNTLALSLNNLYHCLAQSDRREEALDAIEESLELFRNLAADHPDVTNANLAMTLSNRSYSLSELDRHDEALSTMEESQDIYRRLAADDPHLFIPELAKSCNSLSFCLLKLGLQQPEKALDAAEEAIRLYGGLAASFPAIFDSYLAQSLYNLSLYHSYLGQLEEALHPSEEAAAIYRRITAERPAVYSKDCASSIFNLYSCLFDLGRHEEALRVIEELILLYQSLATEQPTIFLEYLALTLVALSNCQSKLHRRDEALKAAEESVQHFRELAADYTPRFTWNLGNSLGVMSQCQTDLDLHEQSLLTSKETVDLYRQLTAEMPSTSSLEHVASSLQRLSICFSKVGRLEEALETVEEAVEIHRQLEVDHPQSQTNSLMQSLTTLKQCLTDLGRHEDACRVEREIGEVGPA